MAKMIYNQEMSYFFSNRLKKVRVESGYTQDLFAKILNVSQNTISNWETGRQEPSYHHLILISYTLKVSVDYLLGLDEETISAYSLYNREAQMNARDRGDLTFIRGYNHCVEEIEFCQKKLRTKLTKSDRLKFQALLAEDYYHSTLFLGNYLKNEMESIKPKIIDYSIEYKTIGKYPGNPKSHFYGTPAPVLTEEDLENYEKSKIEFRNKIFENYEEFKKEEIGKSLKFDNDNQLEEHIYREKSYFGKRKKKSKKNIFGY